jgi:hypothetical protein
VRDPLVLQTTAKPYACISARSINQLIHMVWQ